MPAVEVAQAEPHISVITLNRPDRLNALNFELVAELHDALDEVGRDPDCKVAILTGAGRGFCAGLDLKEWGMPPGPGEHAHVNIGIDGQAFMSNLTVHMRNTPQVIVAAVNGAAFGGGLALACAADIRIASSSARFCSAFIRTGLTGTDIGITYLLPRLIGTARAFDLILSGREVDAAEAERMGIVSQVAPGEELMKRVMDYARVIAGYTRTGLVMTKEVLWHNVDNPSMTAAIALENRNQNIANRADDVQEFMRAYRRRTTG
ncbi:MAG TPA: enoyl-CoA hydratase-related protein [Acidimicrobiales bacterium]|jgi:enoyl-CoA hydratase|nr:enoyl-CoA hydratase-related protein [Acidimicrobiales bacterium]